MQAAVDGGDVEFAAAVSEVVLADGGRVVKFIGDEVDENGEPVPDAVPETQRKPEDDEDDARRRGGRAGAPAPRDQPGASPPCQLIILWVKSTRRQRHRRGRLSAVSDRGR